MIKYTRIPALNDLRFIAANDSLAYGYDTWPFDRGFYEQHIREWQHDIPYQQKRNYRDLITIYLDSLAPNMRLHMLDQFGNPLIEPIYPISGYLVEPGNVAPNGDPYYTFLTSAHLFDYYSMPVERQIIYLVMEAVYGAPGDADSMYYVTEPIYFSRTGWENTVLLEYTQDENDFDVLFEQLSPVFRVRVEGDLLDDDMTSHDTSFEDQQYLVRNLQSVPGQLFKCMIGGLEGVPAYIRDKVNRGISCKNFKVDKIQLVKDTGAKWSRKEVEGYPLEAASIILQPATPFTGTSTGGGFTPLLHIPMDGADPIFPFAINFLWIGDGFTTKNTNEAKVFADMTALNNYLNYLNAFFVPAHDLAGTYNVIDNVIGYNNTPSENYHFMPGMAAYWAYLPAELYLDGGDGGFYRFSMRPSNPGDLAKAIVDWGDGNVQYRFADTTTFNIDHTYAAGVSHVVMRIFHAGPVYSSYDSITSLKFTYGGSGVKLCGFPTGHPNAQAPVQLNIFSVGAQNFAAGTSPDIDVTFLKYCRFYLSNLSFVQSYIGNANNFTNNMMDIGSDYFTVIEYIDISNNFFTVAQINDIIDAIYHHMYTTPIKTMLFNGQTPPAPPSGIGAGWVYTMITLYGFTVITD